MSVADVQGNENSKWTHFWEEYEAGSPHGKARLSLDTWVGI